MRKLKKPALFGVLAAVLVAVYIGIGESARDDVWALIGRGASRNTDLLRVPQAGTSLVPGTDNVFSLGSSSLKFSDVRTYDMTLSDDLTVGDDLAVTGDVTATAAFITPPATVQSVAADSTTISPSAPFVLIGSTGNITLDNAIPTITTATAVAGQRVVLVSTAATITLQDVSARATSGLILPAGTIAVSTSVAREFVYYDSFWRLMDNN